MIVPKADEIWGWSYRPLILANGLKVLIVSDPTCDKAACSLDVCIGSMHDGPDFPGLAHFLEHMLFYASEKYPKEDEYSKFIQDHGGRTNAWTSATDTCYIFDVNFDSLEPAMDRFAQFFVSPLISADGIDREVNAVDAEHSKNLQSDPWRLMQVARHLSNPDHPWSRFHTGSKDTLLTIPQTKGLDTRDAVKSMHSTLYSSHLMCLSVFGRQSLDELEAMITPRFSPIPRVDVPPLLSLTQPVFLPGVSLKKLIKVMPINDKDCVEIAWTLPPAHLNYKSAPLSFLSHLLGHEGKGSLFQDLKSKGLANSLVAGESGLSINEMSFFYLKLELTEQGQAQVHTVLGLCWKYIEIIKEGEGRWSEIFEEVKGLAHIRFDFRDKPGAYSFVSSLTSQMQLYPTEDLLLSMYHVPLLFDPSLIKATLDSLSIDNCRITWQSQKFESLNDLEPVYFTKYSISDIPSDWIQSWQQSSCQVSLELFLPQKNPFIPSDFALTTEATEEVAAPTVIKDNAKLKLLFKSDTTFKTPKAEIILSFLSPVSYQSPEAAVMTSLFTRLVMDTLNERTYDAELAGLRFNLYNTQTGFMVKIGGYNHKLGILLSQILEACSDFVVALKLDRLELIKAQMRKVYVNMANDQPYSIARYRQGLISSQKKWAADDYLSVIDEIGRDDLVAFHQSLFGRLFVEGLVIGNYSLSDLQAPNGVLDTIEKCIFLSKPVFQSQMKDLRCVCYPQGTSIFVQPGSNASNDNSSVVVSYQIDPESIIENALAQLLVQLSERDAFNTLRTKEQLGYIVWAFRESQDYVQAISFIVQSNAYSVLHLVERVDAFVDIFLSEILKLKCSSDSNEFEEAVEELSKSKLEKLKTLSQLANRVWGEINNGSLLFCRHVDEEAALRKLSRQELLGFASKVFGECKRLIVGVCGKNEIEASGETDREAYAKNVSLSLSQAQKGQAQVIESISQFKSGLSLYPSRMN